MSKSYLFESFRQWRICMAAALKSLGWGLTKVISGIILGIVSILVWLWHCACKWVGKYPNIALGGFIVIVIIVWFLSFACNKAKIVGLEAQRDSISWQYQQFKESHGYE